MRYIPQQNSIAERNNIAIMEIACNMLETKNFPNEYWDEAVTTIVYIINWCLTKSMKKKYPQESLTNIKHSVSHLKVFGFAAYAHVPDELRKKLENKAQKCIFVGYSEDTKAYKLYDHVARKVIISRDVQFFENESWDGIVNINVTIVSNVDNDDMVEEVAQTPQISQPVATPTNPIIP